MRRLTQSPAILLLFITCVLPDVITTAQGVEINQTQCIQQRQQQTLRKCSVDICSAGRCTYTVPHGLTELNDKDCDLVWRDQDGVLIADPDQPDKLDPRAVEVTPAHLTTNDCLDGVWIEISCRGTGGACKVEFSVPDADQYQQGEAENKSVKSENKSAKPGRRRRRAASAECANRKPASGSESNGSGTAPDEKSTPAAGRSWTVVGVTAGVAFILCAVFGIWYKRHSLREKRNTLNGPEPEGVVLADVAEKKNFTE